MLGERPPIAPSSSNNSDPKLGRLDRRPGSQDELGCLIEVKRPKFYPVVTEVPSEDGERVGDAAWRARPEYQKRAKVLWPVVPDGEDHARLGCCHFLSHEGKVRLASAAIRCLCRVGVPAYVEQAAERDQHRNDGDDEGRDRHRSPPYEDRSSRRPAHCTQHGWRPAVLDLPPGTGTGPPRHSRPPTSSAVLADSECSGTVQQVPFGVLDPRQPCGTCPNRGDAWFRYTVSRVAQTVAFGDTAIPRPVSGRALAPETVRRGRTSPGARGTSRPAVAGTWSGGLVQQTG